MAKSGGIDTACGHRRRARAAGIADPGRLQEILARLAHELCDSLAAHGRSGRTIAIKVRLDDFTTVTRARTLALPTCDGDLVSAAALELLRAYAPERPVRLLGVRVAGFSDGDTRQADADAAAQDGEGGAGTAPDQLQLPVGAQ